MTGPEQNLPFHKPYITDDEISEVLDSLKSGWLTTGPKCIEFEKRFSEYIGCKHAVAVNSGTAALHLALEAIGIREGDRVITTTMTFAATAEVVRYFNAKPVLVDIDPETMNIDVDKLEQTVLELTSQGNSLKAIIPVHMAGLPCEMDRIMHIAKEHDLKVIEDAAHALPASYKGRMIGTIGDITCFSFYATKNITTGEGGMAVTDNPEWAERMRIMSLHGISKDAWKRYTDEGNWYYEVVAPGYKYNLTDIAAAIGLAQLKNSDFFCKRREEIASHYTRELSKLAEIDVPKTIDNMLHSWHLYIIRINEERLKIDRNRFIEELKNRGIGTSVHFIPLHMHPYYRETYGYTPEDFPVASDIFSKTITLPLYPRMSEADVTRVINAVTDIVTEHRS